MTPFEPEDINVGQNQSSTLKYTIKDGIIFDAKQLLKDVEEMVREAKIRDGELIKY